MLLNCLRTFSSIYTFHTSPLKAGVYLSGGEPLIRKDFYELAEYAYNKGLRIVISTNATLIDEETAVRLKKLGFVYVGASLDGIGDVNDHFRGKKGAFDDAVRGI
ncbi:unnamed protein product, partial [marine sediment metagenome]